MSEHEPPDPRRAWSPEVIDLRGLDSLAATSPAPSVKVHIDRHVSPLEAMSPQERKRLYVRVLCELVAYGETEDEPADDVPARPAPLRSVDDTSWSPTLTRF